VYSYLNNLVISLSLLYLFSVIFFYFQHRWLRVSLARLNVLRGSGGQGLVEYALILALVAVVVVASLTLLGPAIGNIFSEIHQALTLQGSGGSEGPGEGRSYGSEWLFMMVLIMTSTVFLNRRKGEIAG
jgi:pilus assembly protein Flp/PilA